VGSIEFKATLVPRGPAAAVVLVHDGQEGQLTRTRGALSFRVGDLFSGLDREQMRLTEAGDLGLGTQQPQAKLDVAGDIRAPLPGRTLCWLNSAFHSQVSCIICMRQA